MAVPRRLVFWLVVVACVAPVAIALRPHLAYALCVVQREEGKWRNADAATRSITRIELRFTCQDQILNGEPYPPGPPWHIHIWGKCHPTDCDWGEIGAERLGSGHIYGRYNQGFAR